MGNGIRVGDRAPDFDAIDQHGANVRLFDLLDCGPVVLYFYPRDGTPGCTAQACAFRDEHDAFVDAGATVVGVSSDSVIRHRAFAFRHELPFTLVSDEAGCLRQLYQVPKTLGMLPGRVTYVIDSEGVVRHVFSSQLRVRAHRAEALVSLRRLARARTRH